jgi:hypothetical protein
LDPSSKEEWRKITVNLLEAYAIDKTDEASQRYKDLIVMNE